MATNRLYLRCTLCHDGLPLARLSAGDDVWTPARTDPEALAQFLRTHTGCAVDGVLHVALQSENDRQIAVALHNPSSVG